MSLVRQGRFDIRARHEGVPVFPGPIPGFANEVADQAESQGQPIVPVGIGGSERVMPRHAKFVYPRKVHVEIGPPIMPPVAAEGERLPRTVYKEHSAKLHAELQRLFDLAMTRVPWDYDGVSDHGL